MTQNPKNHFTLCLVEDNDDDVFLIRKAVCQTAPSTEMITITDGEQLLKELGDRSRNGRPLPALVVLDINMPCMDGFETLEAMKADTRFRRLPVLILTTSSRREDVQRAFELGAASYFVKPAEFENLLALMEQILHYWRSVTRIPASG